MKAALLQRIMCMYIDGWMSCIRKFLPGHIGHYYVYAMDLVEQDKKENGITFFFK